MKVWLVLLLLLSAACAQEYVPGEVIVKFRGGVSVAEDVPLPGAESMEPVFKALRLRQALMGAASSDDAHGLERIYLVRLNGTTVLEAVEEYRRQPFIEYAEPNMILYPDAEPNDPYYSLQYAHALTNAETGWDLETGNESIVVAVLGEGVNYTHPDLIDNIWNNTDEVVDGGDTDGNGYVDDIRGWDSRFGDNDPMPAFTDNHETMVAGIVAARGNNSLGVAGICWNCRIMPVRMTYTTSGLLDALDYAIAANASIISMSFGNYDPYKYGAGSVENTIDEAVDQGILCVATAGNDRINRLRYPAALDNVVAVGNSDQGDERYTSSNYGPWVEVAAPGASIVSTDNEGNLSTGSGTSFSCPYVSGLAGLMMSLRPDLNVSEVRDILKYSGDKIEADGYIGLRVNVEGALTLQAPPDLYALIKYPYEREIVSNGTMAVQGTAFGDYTLEYSNVSQVSWTSIGSGSDVDGVLGTLDVDSLSTGQYMVRLNATNDTGFDTHNVSFYVDADVMLGWPQHTYETMWCAPTVYDLDGDGDLEVLVGDGRGKMHVWHHNGSVMDGWPKSFLSSDIMSSLAVGDVTGDGEPEVVGTSISSSAKRVAVAYLNGSYAVGWPKSVSSESYAAPVLADVDGDGVYEILVADYDGDIYLMNGTGGWLANWSIADNIEATPAAADLDGDGDPEFIVSTDNRVNAYHHNGTIYNGWEDYAGGEYFSPVVADLDLDGVLDVVTGGDEIRIYNASGDLLANGNELSNDLGGFALADADGDGDLEIFASDNADVHGLHHNLSSLEGWPVSPSYQVRATPVVGDIDGDGEVEVLIGSYADNLYAYNLDGSAVDGFPKYVLEDVYRAAAVADLDLDGDVEVLAPSNAKNLVAWDFNTDYNSSLTPWPMFQGDAQNSGTYTTTTTTTTTTLDGCSGGGPPGSGDWNITETNQCWVDDIHVTGRLRVENSTFKPTSIRVNITDAVLEFVNGTLELADSVLAFID